MAAVVREEFGEGNCLLSLLSLTRLMLPSDIPRGRIDIIWSEASPVPSDGSDSSETPSLRFEWRCALPLLAGGSRWRLLFLRPRDPLYRSYSWLSLSVNIAVVYAGESCCGDGTGMPLGPLIYSLFNTISKRKRYFCMCMWQIEGEIDSERNR